MKAQPLTPAAFADYGQVISCAGDEFALINAGKCKRFNDLANFDIVDGSAGLSLFQSELRTIPYECDLLERHPLGSQCFIPMGQSEYIVVVAKDVGGPTNPVAFHAKAHQCVNIGRNVWHGVLAPISGTGTFAVMDRIGKGPNLEEHMLAETLNITL